MTTVSLTLPVPGSTLNSVADPQMVTAFQALQTWANGGVDGSNIALTAAYLALKPTLASSNTGATTGNLYRVSGTTTITLPGHAAGQVVGVYCISGTTTVSGTAIQGLGLSSASSFTLGVPGAAAILVDDGTNWNIVAGQQDTGWLALTPQSGFTLIAPNGFQGAARLRGDTVMLCGSVKNGTGGTASNVAWATLPALVPTPTQLIGWAGTTGASGFAAINIGLGLSPTNAVFVFAAVPNNGYICLDGLTYRVS